MLLPSIFGESLLDEFFDHPHQRTHYQSHVSEMMRTDIKDLGNAYEMTMNLPGIKKENVKAELKDGYLTISASSASQNEEKEEGQRWGIHQAGTLCRYLQQEFLCRGRCETGRY